MPEPDPALLDLLQQLAKGVHGKITSVLRSLRQASNLLYQLRARNLSSLFNRSPRHHLCNRRSAGHCAHTAFSAEPDLEDPPGVHRHRKLENVSAPGVLQADARISIFHPAHVSRSREMIQ